MKRLDRDERSLNGLFEGVSRRDSVLEPRDIRRGFGDELLGNRIKFHGESPRRHG